MLTFLFLFFSSIEQQKPIVNNPYDNNFKAIICLKQKVYDRLYLKIDQFSNYSEHIEYGDDGYIIYKDGSFCFYKLEKRNERLFIVVSFMTREDYFHYSFLCEDIMDANDNICFKTSLIYHLSQIFNLTEDEILDFSLKEHYYPIQEFDEN